MIVKINNFGDLHKKGVYSITNKVNEKIYIGSTFDSFKNRWITHIKKLRSGKHPNIHLQSAWDKYTEDKFEFSILEILEEGILEKEQYYIDTLESCNPKKGYNLEINTYKREIAFKTKNKISDTLKRKYQSGELTKEGCQCAGWNKGKKCPNIGKARRELFSSIKVYNYNYDLIVTFQSCIDLCEWSEENRLPELVIGKANRKGHILRRDKIYLSIRTGKCYKGLYFQKGEPLSSETGIAKWENNYQQLIENDYTCNESTTVI